MCLRISARLTIGQKGQVPVAPKVTDLYFNQTEGPQIFKNMISFFSGLKINPKLRAPKFMDVNFIQKEGPQTFFHKKLYFGPK
jgi:hypothetical protein